MLTLKVSVVTAVLVGTALISAGAGYGISRATLAEQVAVSCPVSNATSPAALPHALPNGPAPAPNAGKKW